MTMSVSVSRPLDEVRSMTKIGTLGDFGDCSSFEARYDVTVARCLKWPQMDGCGMPQSASQMDASVCACLALLCDEGDHRGLAANNVVGTAA